MVKKSVFFVLLLSLLFTGCISRYTITPDYYKDYYFSNSKQYINQSIGFTLNFDESWNVYSNYQTMPEELKRIADKFSLEKGSELLFFAFKEDINLGCRLTVEANDIPLKDYFNNIYNVSKNSIKSDICIDKIKIVGIDMIEWILITNYNNSDITYFDYQFKKDKYNFRFSFFCPANDMYDNIDEVYLILNSLGIEENKDKLDNNKEEWYYYYSML